MDSITLKPKPNGGDAEEEGTGAAHFHPEGQQSWRTRKPNTRYAEVMLRIISSCLSQESKICLTLEKSIYSWKNYAISTDVKECVNF